MAGIFGIQNYHGVQDLAAQCATLLNAAQQGFDHPYHWHDFDMSTIGVAIPHHYSNTKWPLVTTDGMYALAVFGEIYLPGGDPLRASNFEDCFVRPFLAAPEQFLLKLDGAFNFTLMTPSECMIASDPFGSFALHYALSGDCFLFASQMDGLRRLMKNRSIDETGLLQYLGLGMTLAGRTTFSNISRLAGGTLLTASREGIHTKQYYKPSYHANANKTKSLLEQIRNDFERSVLRRANYPRVAAALTGGFDSRATWSILLNRHVPIPSHTHGLPDCSDLTISKRIAEAFEIPRENVIFDQDFIANIPSYWREIVRLSEGGISIAHAPTIMVLEQLKEQCSVMLDSYGGTFYRRQRMKVAERVIHQSEDLIPQILRFERSPLLRSGLLKYEAKLAMEKISADGLTAYYYSISNTPLLGNKLDLFHFEQVDVMRDALLSNSQMNFIGLAHPFLTLPAIEATTSLPLAVRRRDAAHKYIVHASSPKLERFWMDNVGFTTPYHGFSTLRYGAMVAERILRKTGQILPGLFGHTTLRKPTMDVPHLLQPGLAQAKEILLTPHVLFDQFIDRNAVERSLRELENEDYESGAAIVQLLSFRIFLDLFF